MWRLRPTGQAFRLSYRRMAILQSCCCWKSVRTGSFACAIYTLTFYIIVVTASAFHVNLAFGTPVLFTFSILVLIFSGLCVISSILLLVGLCVDNRFLLLPWMISVSMTTLLDILLAFYLIADVMEEPLVGILFVVDILISGLNVYCILCVVSQFQDYLAGRDNSRHVMDEVASVGPDEIPRNNGLLHPSMSTTEILSIRYATSPSSLQPIFGSHSDIQECPNKLKNEQAIERIAPLIIVENELKLVPSPSISTFGHFWT